MKYINVAKSHNHVMALGGNVPDSLIEHELLGANNSTNDISNTNIGASAVSNSPADNETSQKKE